MQGTGFSSRSTLVSRAIVATVAGGLVVAMFSEALA